MKSVPENWHIAKVADVTMRAKQRDPSKSPNETFRYVDVSSISNTLFKIVSATELLGKEAPSRARKEIKANDVLFATVRPTLKRIALVPKELDNEIASTGYCVLRPNTEKISPSYLYHRLLTDEFVKKMGALERGASYPAVRDSDVLSAEIPIPPLDEQRGIAHVLTTVQTAIEQQAKLIDLTRELKSALMKKLFTEGLRGEKQKETEIGLVPAGWDVVCVSEMGEVVTGRTPSTNHPEYYDGEFRLISPADLDNGKYVKSAHRTLTKEGFEQCRALPVNTILVGCIGNVGKIGMTFDDKSATNQQINSIICNPSYNPYFVYYCLQHNRMRLENIAAKVTVPIVNKSNFENFKVASPPKEQQDEIADTLTVLDNKVEILESKKNLLEELFRTLLHQLMTGQVRVKDLEI